MTGQEDKTEDRRQDRRQDRIQKKRYQDITQQNRMKPPFTNRVAGEKYEIETGRCKAPKKDIPCK